jgi:hypothetical protein
MSDQIEYPIDTIREVAHEILTQVSTSRQQHGTQWNIIQQYISQCAPSYKPLGMSPSFGFAFGDGVQGHMQDVLTPHAQRLNSSYDWLEKFANALLDAANDMEAADQHVKDSFGMTIQ